MVAVLIATLIAGIAVWFYLRSTNAAGSITTPTGDVSQGTLGGIDFTAPGTASQAAASADATAYDPNDPATAQRRLDALNRAQILQQKADAQGITPEQDYQNHLAQDLAAQQAETQAIMDAAAKKQAAELAAAASAAAAAASAAANGGASMPTPTMTVARRGIGHFGGVSSTPDVLPSSNSSYATAVLNAGPTTAAPGPGYVWNFYTQQWQPALN